MKKLVCCGLSALLSATMFGCSSSSGGSDGDKVELTFWGHQNEPWAASYQKIAREFEEKNPDIHINIEFFPYDQFESKVQTSLISKEGGADIYELWGGWGLDFASTGALAEIPENLSKTIHDDVYPSTIGALEYEGKLYGLPMEFNIENGAMLVNKKLMSEHNLKTPTTWKELRETAKKATKKDGDTITIKGFDFVNWDSVPYMFLSMILSTGGTYQNEDGSFNLQTPQAKAALQELYDMVKVDGVTTMEGLDGGGDMEGYQQLYAGNVVMVPRGPWTIAEGITSFGLEYGKDFDYVSMPWFGDKPAFAAETGWSMAVNGNSKQQEAAMLINFLLNEAEGIEISGTQRGIPCSAAGLALLNEKGLGDALVKEANAKVMGYSEFPLDPKFEHNDLKANPDGVYYKVFGKLSAGDIDSAKAAQDLMDGVNECMGN